MAKFGLNWLDCSWHKFADNRLNLLAMVRNDSRLLFNRLDATPVAQPTPSQQ